MLNIFLLILKIIGIVLLVVLLLVLLVLLLVSWVPIRYSADFSKYEKILLNARVTWFLKAVGAEFSLDDKGHRFRLKLFGKDLSGGGDEPAEGKGEAAQETAGETAPEERPEITPESEAPTDTTSEKTGDETCGTEDQTDEKAAAQSEETDEKAGDGTGEAEEKAETGTEAAGETVSPESGPEEEPEEATEEASEEAVPPDEKLADILDKIHDGYLSFEEKWDGISDKIGFFTEEHAMREYGRLLKTLGKLLKHILPHRMSGQLRFGFDSPDITGKILAYYCALAPVHRYALIPEPDFTRSVLEGEVSLEGRIFIGYLILKVLAAVLNRDVLYLLLNFRKHFRKSQEG